MFIGRETELQELQRLYDADVFQFSVIYGRRRVGKTALIERFTHGRLTIYFTAVEGDAGVNLRNLSQEIYALQQPNANPSSAPVFADYYAAFDSIFALAEKQRLVFVIDEFPYLAKAEPAVSSYLQALIDRNKSISQLFLVLCGSSLSFMKEQVLGEKSPLYGRRTAQFEVKPFDYFDSRLFLKGMSNEDALCVYGMTGGIPLYLLQFSGAASLEENIEQAFLRPSSILYEEPTNLLKQEVQKAAQYNAVLSAIAGGASQNNEIASAVGVTPTELTYYLKELQRIGLVDRELPVVNAGRRAIYRISDNLFRFWYRFVLSNRSTLERGITTRAKRTISEHLPVYMGPVFEDVCKQWLWRVYSAGNLDFDFDDIGRWWGGDPQVKEEAEIDLVCAEGTSASAVGECKWKSGAFPRSDLEKLLDRARLVHSKPSVKFYAFSRSGFTDSCCELASSDPRIRLIDFEKMT